MQTSYKDNLLNQGNGVLGEQSHEPGCGVELRCNVVLREESSQTGVMVLQNDGYESEQ